MSEHYIPHIQTADRRWGVCFLILFGLELVFILGTSYFHGHHLELLFYVKTQSINETFLKITTCYSLDKHLTESLRNTRVPYQAALSLCDVET